jgi:long-subunit acyl-CoA synthetase (AMP-forming)
MTRSVARGVVSVEGLAERESLAAVFQETSGRASERIALRTPDDSVSLTWGQYRSRVEAIAEGLAAAGVSRGDGVGLLLTTRPEFHLADTAALHLGAYTTSVYTTLPPADMAYVLQDSGVKILFTEAALLENARAATAGLAGIELITVDGNRHGLRTLSDLESVKLAGFDFESRWRAVQPDDLALVTYTSGTTGTPKGVELTHAAILGNQQGLNTADRIFDGARAVSYLPMAHAAERHLSHYRPMVGGFTVTTVNDHTQLSKVLADFQPDHFFSPPRLYEKFRASLLLTAESWPSDLRAEFDRLMELGARELEAHEGSGAPLSPSESEMLQRLRAAVGKPLLAMVGLASVTSALTGSAPVPKDIIVFYAALGMRILEAWGQSESGAFGAFNTVEQSRVGTVGRALPGCAIKLLDDGEILLKSPWLMRGYRNRPEDTRSVIDDEGWLHTGDLGAMSSDGFLSIIGRKKEIIINSFGKNMSPANIESKLCDADPIIAHAVAVGDGRPHVGALLVLDPAQLQALAAKLGIGDEPLERIVTHGDVHDRIAKAVDKANAQLSRVESVRSFTILPTEWRPASDELTPTMKLRRREVHRKYAKEIDALP